ncbi:hypothetical protein AB0945_25365 [Streptomyces sp. NPDC005474]|uniref:hypothetical protein n=1 Tax=Streptomyces sp. NPDC005474 TaxID=3154878 RepID=UPI003451439B
MPKYEIRSGDRAEFIAGLRELSDFLTANPRVLVPHRASFGCEAFVILGGWAARLTWSGRTSVERREA